MRLRPRVMNGIAASAGVALAIVVLELAAGVPPPGVPTTILSAGSSETIPSFHHVSIWGSSYCGSAQCGSPGELRLEFSVAVHARLAGSLRADAPIGVWVGNDAGIAAACGLSNPPPPCAPVAGTPYLFQEPNEVTSIDFGELGFGFPGPVDTLPSGTWTILLINSSDTEVQVSAGSDVRVIPSW